MPVDPVTSTVAASINVTFKLAEFILSVQAASEEIDIFGRLIQRVRRDRAEALRERVAKDKLLTETPEKLSWVNSALADTNYALLTIGKTIENARIDGQKGKTITLKHRFEWVLAHKEEFQTKQAYLSTCHQSLATALNYMHSLRVGPNVHHRMPSPPPTYKGSHTDSEDTSDPVLRSPSSRRPRLQGKYSLPNTSPVELQTNLEDLWEERFGPRSTDWLGSLSRQDSAVEPRWEDASGTKALTDAADAIISLGCDSAAARAMAESLQRTTTDARRRRREAYLSASEDANDGASVSTAEAPALKPRNLNLSRRRKIEAHFEP